MYLRIIIWRTWVTKLYIYLCLRRLPAAIDEGTFDTEIASWTKRIMLNLLMFILNDQDGLVMTLDLYTHIYFHFYWISKLYRIILIGIRLLSYYVFDNFLIMYNSFFAYNLRAYHTTTSRKYYVWVKFL